MKTIVLAFAIAMLSACGGASASQTRHTACQIRNTACDACQRVCAATADSCPADAGAPDAQ